MSALLFCIAIAVCLFGASFFAKRRFGLLGLALAAGSILSGIWGYDAGLIAGIFGFDSSLIVTSVISSIIVLLPAVVLLFHGYAYKTVIGRLIGAGLFTVLALAFLIQPLGNILTIGGVGSEAYNWLLDNKSMVIGAGLIAAVVDIFLTKPVGSSKKR